MPHADDLRLVHWIRGLGVQAGTFAARTARVVFALLVVLVRVPGHAATVVSSPSSSPALLVMVIHVVATVVTRLAVVMVLLGH